MVRSLSLEPLSVSPASSREFSNDGWRKMLTTRACCNVCSQQGLVFRPEGRSVNGERCGDEVAARTLNEVGEGRLLSALLARSAAFRTGARMLRLHYAACRSAQIDVVGVKSSRDRGLTFFLCFCSRPRSPRPLRPPVRLGRVVLVHRG